MGKHKQEFPPPWHNKRSCSTRSEVWWCDCVAGKAEEECLHPEHRAHRCGGTFDAAKAKPESAIQATTKTRSTVWRSWTRWREQTPSKAVREDGQWWSSITSSNWPGSMPASCSREHQQQESLEGSPAATGRGAEGRIPAGERAQGGQQRKQLPQQQQQQQTRTRRQFQS